jgi:hypothetical protein
MQGVHMDVQESPPLTPEAKKNERRDGIGSGGTVLAVRVDLQTP